MTKQQLLLQIIRTLEADLKLISGAARTAHAAATHEECAPDNKYDTTALEASYVAQGQANRAQEIKLALENYRKLDLIEFQSGAPIRLTALVKLEDANGNEKMVFLGPDAGGLKIHHDGFEVIVITPVSPLGRNLIGQCVDDELSLGTGPDKKSYTIVAID